MPTFTISAEVALHTINSPGTWLPNRDDIYVTIDAFNIVKRSRLMDPIFPIILHERFRFEKTLFNVDSLQSVYEILEDFPITVEVRQVTDIYLGGTLLAYFDSSAREFFCPYSSQVSPTVNEREFIMCRTVDFPGVPPRVDFSVYAAIDLSSARPSRHGGGGVPLNESFSNNNTRVIDSYEKKCRCGGSKQVVLYHLKKSPGYHSAFSIPDYERPTVNSILRTRPKTPNSPQRYPPPPTYTKPMYSKPFAVRKVDDNLLSRSKTPPCCYYSTPPPQASRENTCGWRPRSVSPGMRYSPHSDRPVVRGEGAVYSSPLSCQSRPNCRAHYFQPSRGFAPSNHLSKAERDVALYKHRSKEFIKLAHYWDKQVIRLQNKKTSTF